MTRKFWIQLLIALQIGGLTVIAVIWWQRTVEADQVAAFEALKQAVIAGGAQAGLAALPPEVIEAGTRACARQACVDERFDASSGRWLMATVARRGVDPCADFKAPDCTESRTRAALLRLLPRVPDCEVDEVVEAGADRLRVRCGDVVDFVPVTRGATGWRLDGDTTWPGLLPRLSARVSGARPPAHATPP